MQSATGQRRERGKAARTVGLNSQNNNRSQLCFGRRRHTPCALAFAVARFFSVASSRPPPTGQAHAHSHPSFHLIFQGWFVARVHCCRLVLRRGLLVVAESYAWRRDTLRLRRLVGGLTSATWLQSMSGRPSIKRLFVAAYCDYSAATKVRAKVQSAQNQF